MTISYKWLSEYLPVTLAPERLENILTNIGLEVESVHHYEAYKGGLAGLLIGEVLSCDKHPNADKLKLTKVNVGTSTPLSIVCGAANVAAGQKVVVAPVGATIHPINHEPVTMKLAKIRGEESEGMICAEDEIGIGTSHNGIMVLPADAVPGTPASEYFDNYSDIIYEIGLTPNRMDAMSHWGVARDVCVYLSHHDKQDIKPKLPDSSGFTAPEEQLIKVTVENTIACPRYSGISIKNVVVKESPKWLQQRLKAIGVKPINNIVDVTNYIQHETGQPLHAFDADTIQQQKIIVKNLPEGTVFTTLDDKERKLSEEDLMICDADGGLCIAGVFGGLHSGVTTATKHIFLESAFFAPVGIRKTSFRHGLRTDAATRFEKETDISATVKVLQRAALLIQEMGAGTIAAAITDAYPNPQPKKQVQFSYAYLKRLSGKQYLPADVKNILVGLGFAIISETEKGLQVSVPYHKPDITVPADIVEEILRIDGLDNVSIPSAITITPSVDDHVEAEALKEKLSNYLTGLGCHEILTNSITNKAYYSEQELATAVLMKNSLSAELNMMRPSMLPTGLEVVRHNLHRKNDDLKLFEWGRTYTTKSQKGFVETEHLCLFLCGKKVNDSWKAKGAVIDFYSLKGIAAQLVALLGLPLSFAESAVPPTGLETALDILIQDNIAGCIGVVNKNTLGRFDIKQPVFCADFYWDVLYNAAAQQKAVFCPIPKFPAVQRDIAMVVPRQLKYALVESTIRAVKLKKLRDIQLFDVFESDKLGVDKKSLAVNFTFLDEEKTLTDTEIDGWMKKIMQSLENDLQAEIRGK